MASLSVSGLVPISPAMAGSDVEMTVESIFSMNRAVATISGITRCLFMKRDEESRGIRGPAVSFHPLPDYGENVLGTFCRPMC